jgi:hypothetical protein
VGFSPPLIGWRAKAHPLRCERKRVNHEEHEEKTKTSLLCFVFFVVQSSVLELTAEDP